MYEGHAPEELVNGSEYDTLDMRIYTRPGSDWIIDGHGFQVQAIRYTYEPAITSTLSWAGVVEHPIQVLVSNLTTGYDLTVNLDYTVDWLLQTITINTGVSANDIVNINVYELGGGSQLYRANYPGDEVVTANNRVIIPVGYNQLVAVPVFVNGALSAIPELRPYSASIAWNLDSTYQPLDVVFNDNQITCTATSNIYNIITCNDTSSLTVGQPIVFSGTTFGGIVAGTEYYVLTIAKLQDLPHSCH